MQMPGQNQVVAALTRRFPDARIVRAENFNIALGQRGRLGAGDGNHARSVRYLSDASMNPTPAAALDRAANSIDANALVMVAPHGEDWRQFAERGDQIAQLAQFRRPIREIAAQAQQIDGNRARRCEDLLAEHVGAGSPQMDIADIHQPAGVALR